MKYVELVEELEKDNKELLREIARIYLQEGEFHYVEMELELEPRSFMRLLVERPDLRSKLSTAIDDEFSEEQKIASRARIRKALDTLSSTMDNMDDPTTTMKAALGILNFDMKFLRSGRKTDEEDDLDKLWKEVTSELKTKKNTKNSKPVGS